MSTDMEKAIDTAVLDAIIEVAFTGAKHAIPYTGNQRDVFITEFRRALAEVLTPQK